MRLVRTIILKLILTIHTVSSLDVININISTSTNYGMSVRYDNWVTENQPFIIHIQSDTDLDDTIMCTWDGRKEIHKIRIKKTTNKVYVSDYIIAIKAMNGRSNCRASYSHGRLQEFFIYLYIDVDECSETPPPCSSHANCTNTLGGYNCSCLPGYKGSGKYCEVADQCQSNPCSSQQVCHSEGDGYRCSDVNPCKSPCHVNAICIDMKPGFKCDCQTGFTGNGSSCYDIDECKSSEACEGTRNTYCKNTEGGFQCECLRGYYINTQGWCEDVDECHRNISDCKKNEVCLNNPGSYTCRPNDGEIISGYSDCPKKCKIANCKIFDGKTECVCPNVIGNYGECAILADAGPPPNRHTRKSNNLEPSIDILLYGSSSDNTLKHYTTGYDRIILDKRFTISVVRKDKEFRNMENWIICYKTEDPVLIHLNQTLERDADYKYIAQGPKAQHAMNGNWTCLINQSNKLRSWNKLSTIVVEFPVTIIREPFIVMPDKSALDPVDNTIYLEFDNGNTVVRNSTLWFNRPYSIVIKSISNEVINVNSIRCHFASNIEQIFTNNETFVWDQLNEVYRAQQGKVERKMNSYWICYIRYYNSSPNINQCGLKFKVTVKNPEFEKHSYIYVNDVLVNTSRENAKANKGTYEYSVGEIVKVTCNKRDATIMNMSYFYANRFITPKMSDIENQTMYIKIGEVENAYVQCNVILSDTMDDVESITLKFIKKRRRSDLPTFNVNDLPLLPREVTRDNYSLFYEYFEGEFINFTVSNGQRWKEVDGTNKTKLEGGNFTYSSHAHEKTMTFQSEDGKRITFYLIPVPNYFSATISGLPFSQTNIKYLHNKTTYKTVFFNKNNQILNLTCSSRDNQMCTWDQNTTSNDSINTTIKNVTFLPQEHTSRRNVLQCKCGNYIHEAAILRDDGIIKNKKPQGKQKYDASDSDVDKPLEDSLSENNDSNNSNGENNDLFLGSIIVAALVVVAAVVWLMVGLYKRRQRREKAIQSEFNYESLENTSERTMPTPAQWDNYVQPVDRQNETDTDTYSVPYIERNVEEMYAKPQPKTMRKPPNELLYTEPSYASVEHKGDKPTYGNLSNQAAGYSEIKPHKLIGNAKTPKVLPTEDPYAEVLPKSMRPNKESSKYANIFDNQRYVNSTGEPSCDRSEYAEPAYCELPTRSK